MGLNKLLSENDNHQRPKQNHRTNIYINRKSERVSIVKKNKIRCTAIYNDYNHDSHKKNVLSVQQKQ